MAFTSSANLTGLNPEENNEVFLYDVPTGTFTALSPSTSGFSSGASLDASGTKVAFSSDADLTGSNPDGSTEVFLYDTATATVSQITSSSTASGGPALSAAGDVIAFVSNANLAGLNPEGNSEVFVFDVTASSFQAITSSAAGFNQNPAISGDGRWIAFASNTDPTGGNPDGNFEIFLFDRNTPTFIQVTTSPAETGSQRPKLDFDGSLLVFSSGADLVTGGNLDGSTEIFLFDRDLSSLQQITTTLSDDEINPENDWPAIDALGQRIVFQSNADHVSGGNPDGDYEIFLLDRSTGTLTQITDGPDSSVSPVISADGSGIAFYSGSLDELVNIFLASCPRGAVEVPALSGIGIAAFALLLASAAAWVLRNRKREVLK